MAEYKTPENPKQRPRRNRNDSFDWVPLAGLGIGLLVTIVALFAAYQLANQFLTTPPIDIELPEAIVLQLTAPAEPTEPPPTLVAETPTPIPTPTLQPTSSGTEAEGDSEATTVPPATPIEIGNYVEVFDTGGAGLSVRGGPSTDNIKLLVVEEGAVILVLEGPQDGNNLTWWKVLLDDGTEGWVAGQFLRVTDAPDGANE